NRPRERTEEDRKRAMDRGVKTTRGCPFWSSHPLTNPAQLVIVQCSDGGHGMQFDQLKRRELITLLSGAALTWPLDARAQQVGKVPRIGYLSPGSASPGPLAYHDEFQRGLRDIAALVR